MPLILSIPTWATFNKIPVGTPPTGLGALNYALSLSLVEGDDNPVWPDLQDLDLGGGPLTRGSLLTDLAQVTPIENTSFIGVSNAQLAVAVGGEITGMEVYFELDDLGDDVPESFPNRSYADPESVDPENPTMIVHTWATWGSAGDSHAPELIGDKWYKSSADAANLGQPIPASCWVSAGLTVKTVAEFIAIRTLHT